MKDEGRSDGGKEENEERRIDRWIGGINKERKDARMNRKKDIWMDKWTKANKDNCKTDG